MITQKNMIKTDQDSSVSYRQIIVVEDDRDFRESVVEYLALLGFDVVGVESALEFYKSIALQKFLLVILDIGLPDQNGMLLAEYIRNNTDMRIIMLTAQSSLESRITAYQTGADLYLVKPVDFSELSATLHSILGRLDASRATQPELKSTALASGQNQTQWKLVPSDWALCTPAGDKIKLTSKEYDLVEKLASVPNTVVARQELLKVLAYENTDFGNRALDALIHRLRRKKKGLNSGIPIKTAHGSGYCFSAPIVIA
jgi:DNA-binding response OmpR family regulator